LGNIYIDGWNWHWYTFVFAGTLLFGAGLTYELKEGLAMNHQINDRTKLGLGILVTAVVLGILGDGLLRATPWGINILLWTGLLVAAGVGLARWQQVALMENGKWALLTVMLFAGLFAWRDSLTLKALDALALFIALSLATMQVQSVQVRLASIWNTCQASSIQGAMRCLEAHVCYRKIFSGKPFEATGCYGTQ
jgi:hypothetical protein